MAFLPPHYLYPQTSSNSLTDEQNKWWGFFPTVFRTPNALIAPMVNVAMWSLPCASSLGAPVRQLLFFFC